MSKKVHFDLLLDDFESLPNQTTAENYLIIQRGVIRKIKFLEPYNERIIEKFLNTPFEIIKRLEQYSNKNYEVIFPLPKEFVTIKQVRAAVKLNFGQVFIIKLMQGKYWIGQKWLYRDLIAGAIGGFFGYLLARITGT